MVGLRQRSLAAARRAGEVKSYDRLSELLLCAQITAVTFCQKIPIPVGGKTQLFFSMFVLLGVTGVGVMSGRLRVRAVPLLLYALMAGGLGVGQLLGGTDFSYLSYGLLLTLHFPYIFGLRDGSIRPDVHLSYYQNVMTIIAICGVIQFLLQYAIGSDIPYYLDKGLPKKFIMQGYAQLNPLSLGATKYKANGVFLLEPAGLNQNLAIALIIEYLRFRRLTRFAIFLAGVLVTFSGTGLIILALLGPVLLISRGRIDIVLLGALALGLFVVFAEDLGLGFYVKRINEFTNPQTSGYARFISIFYLLNDLVLRKMDTMLFGVGAGSIRHLYGTLISPALEPSWGKILFEYGLLGALVYFPLLFYITFSNKGQSGYLRSALTIQFLILSDYVTVPQVHGLIISFLAWPPAKTSTAQRVEEKGEPVAATGPAGRTPAAALGGSGRGRGPRLPARA